MSEFGKGFTYCIGLFLCHAERNTVVSEQLWFNGAADHLFDIEIPDNFILKNDCQEWVNKCIEWRLEGFTEADKFWAINEAKRFLMEWDRQCGISVEKGNYE